MILRGWERLFRLVSLFLQRKIWKILALLLADVGIRLVHVFGLSK